MYLLINFILLFHSRLIIGIEFISMTNTQKNLIALLNLIIQTKLGLGFNLAL